MSPFDKAWDVITKFDFYMDPSRNERGSYSPPQFVQGNTAPQVSNNPVYSSRAAENKFQQSNAEYYGPQYGPAYQPPLADMSNTANYRTGASEPRLSDDGSFTGVNLSNLDFTDDSKLIENVQNLASIGAHETVHSLIEPEIDDWASAESGYEQETVKPVNFNSPVSQESLMALLNSIRDPAKRNYEKLRELGHEFGAWSSTPDAGDESGFRSPDRRREVMSLYPSIAPYVTGDKPFSELRNTKKSEPFDQAWTLLKMPQEARAFAQQQHEGQMYGEEPYMYHVDEVANQFQDPLLQRIAYLHDVVEDGRVSVEDIHDRFGEDVGHGVDAMTRRPDENYFDYIGRVSEHPHARQVKIADLTHNLSGDPPGSLRQRYEKALEMLS